MNEKETLQRLLNNLKGFERIYEKILKNEPLTSIFEFLEPRKSYKETGMIRDLYNEM